jgi:D-alanyl-D-alanine carboxypeptidase/D-alanyl-D-alanine-endopeptidase (penicillin-binding protein 4)
MRSRFLATLLVVATVFTATPANAVLSPESIPAAFEQLLHSPVLANPAMILIDGTTGAVIYEKNANSQRKPASVMKILSGASALEYLNPLSSFLTTVSLGSEEKTLVINGSFDPWFSLDDRVAKKMHRTSLPRIAFNSMTALKKANSGSLKNIKVFYTGLYSKDVANLKAFWARRGFKPTMKSIGSETAITQSQSTVLESYSPPLLEILDFTMLNSDNLLAERLARLASKAAGHSFDDKGVAITFAELLSHFQIDSSKLVIADASGLSKENRVTATIMGQLLFKLRKEEKFDLLYQSLPVGGVSGTLKDRFTTTAPNAVGLVHAKTGTLNGTVTLAGYVESADREYVFVTLADEIPKGNRASDKARAAIDRILGRIAAPNIETEISEASKLP